MSHKIFRWFTTVIFILTISLNGITPVQAAQPANDHFANAEVISSLPFNATVDNTDATAEPGEPQFCNFPFRTVWYSFTPSETMKVQLDMAGSQANGAIGVFIPIGSTVSDLGLVACASSGNSANFLLEAGQIYYFRVDSFFGQAGSLQINLQQIESPANDDFANAEVIPSLPFNVTADNTNATTEPDEQTVCNSPFRSLWYSFSPGSDMAVKLDAIVGNVSMFVANGPALTDLTLVGCATNNSTNIKLDAGRTYYLQLDSYFGQQGSLQFNLEQITPPANDDYLNAQTIVSLPFSATVDNTNATHELGETQNCNFPFRSVWYSFTPAEDMVIKVDTAGSALGEVVNIFLSTGPAISDLTILGCASFNNITNLQLDAGQTYFFRLDSFGSVGSLQFNIDQVSPPANDSFANAELINILPFTATVDTMNASAEFGEPQDCNFPYRSVWYSFTPIENMTLQASGTSGSTVAVYLASGSTIFDLTMITCAYNGIPNNFNVTAGQTYYLRLDAPGSAGILQTNLQQISPLTNDNFADAEPISSLPFTTVVDNTNATSETGEPQVCSFPFRSVWYSFTPSETMAVRLSMTGSQVGGSASLYRSTGSTISDLEFVGCAFSLNDIPANLLLEAGQTYYLRVDSFFGTPGNLQINLEQIIPPANDNFDSPEVIDSLPFNITADNTNATSESQEPLGCGASRRSLWYSFTPSETMQVRVNTAGSAISANVSVFLASGPAITDLSFLTCAGGTSVFLTLEQGKTYYLQLDSFGEGGMLSLNLEKLNPPANDNFANAEAISATPFNTTVDISDATPETNEPQNCSFMLHTVWYTFTPSETMQLRADTFGSSIDGSINVYRISGGSGLGNLQFLSCSGSTSAHFLAEAGQTYYLQVGSNAISGGILNVHLEQSVPPVNDNLANATIVTSLHFSATANITDATTEQGEPQSCYVSQTTIWYAFTPDHTVKVRADSNGSAINASINIYHSTGSGFEGLQFLTCVASGDATFIAQAGETYYLQVGGINAAGPVQINLAEVPAIRGRITDANTGSPLAGEAPPYAIADLYRICGDGCLEYVNSQQADSEGHIFIDSYSYGAPLVAGSYQITARAELYHTREFGPFEFTGTNLEVGDLPLTPVSLIHGRAVDSMTGYPIQGAYVTLLLCDGDNCSTFVSSQYTNDGGQFLFNIYNGNPLPAGTYQLEFTASLYQTRRFQVTIGESENLDLGDVSIDPIPTIGSISGRLVDAMTGQPVLQVFAPMLSLYRCDGEACIFVNQMSANSDGTFRFETDSSGNHLIIGSYRIYANADQYFTSQVGNFEVGENMNWNVGDIKLNSAPVRFANIQPCDELPSSGGDCVFSVRLYNGTDHDLTGKTWSLASASLSHAFAGYTNFQIKDAQNLDLGKGRNKVVRFRLNIPANPGPDGTYVCTRMFVGEGNQALFNTIGHRDLFCVRWNAGGFAITAAQEAPSALEVNDLTTVAAAEVEPNNSCQAAQDAGAFSDPIVMNGNLDSSESPDIDFFRFTGTPNQAITLDLEGESKGKGTLSDPFMGVFDSDCNLLYVNDDSGSLNSHLEINIPADGVFVVAATTCCDDSFEGGGNGSYQLTIAPLQVIGSISGIVTDVINGRPLSGDTVPFAYVRLLRCEQSGCWDLVAQNVSSDGSFHFDQNSGVTLQPGTYMIIAAADQYQYAQTEMFTVEADENHNAGSIGLTSNPIRFTDTQVCSVSSVGGLCDFSVKITNGLATKFTGKAWSMIDAYNIGSFTDFTTFQADSVRDVSLDPGRSTVLRFRFQVRGSVAEGAVICTTAFVGQKPGALFNTAGVRYLFCFVKGVDGFTLMSEHQMQSELHYLSVNDMNRPNTPSLQK